MKDEEKLGLIEKSNSAVKYAPETKETISTIPVNEGRLKKMGRTIRTALSVDKEMLTSKTAYVFLGTRSGCLMAFMVIFLESVGLSSSQAGMVYAAGFAGLTMGNLFWTMLADRFNAHRLILWIVSILATLFLFSLPLLSLLLGKQSKNTCGKFKHTGDTAMVSKTTLVVVLTAMNFCGYFCDGSTLSFIDTAVTRKIGLSSKKIDFGKQRLYNSVGFAIGSLGGSILVDILPPMRVSCYIGVFLVYACSAVPGLAAGNDVYKSLAGNSENGSKGQTSSNRINTGSSTEWRKTSLAEVITILMTAIILGLVYGSNKSFTMLYVRQLGAANTLIGVCQFVAACSAILTYFVSARIIEALHGEWNAVCLCCATWLLRYTVYVFAKAAWLFLMMQFTHGVSISLFIAALSRFIQKNIDERAYARFYGLTDAFINGTGSIIANVAGGFIYENLGSTYLMGSMAVLSAAWLLFIFMIRWWKSF